MRKAPIITLMEHIRKKLMQAIIERKMECQGWRTKVPSYINKKMNKLLKARRFCHVIPASEVLFEVKDTSKSYMANNKKSHVVNSEDHTCDSGLWQISGLPCSHTMPCIGHLRATYEAYIAHCFTKEAYLKYYSGIIHPLPDKFK